MKGAKSPLRVQSTSFSKFEKLLQRGEKTFSTRWNCQKTMKSSWMIEQQGKSEGGKEPPSRSINQFFKV